jgi:adenylate cyclase
LTTEKPCFYWIRDDRLFLWSTPSRIDNSDPILHDWPDSSPRKTTMSFLAELKRRNVIKATILYLVASWLILQVTDVLIPALTLPESALRLVTMLLILGFPLVLIFSWVFEMTPEGLKREKDIDRSQSIVAGTGRRINTLIVILLVAAIAVVAIDRLIPEQEIAGGYETGTDQAAADPDLAATTTGKAPQRSIAVLPFVNMSGDKENEFFSDGLSEEILNTLVGIDDLQVTARTSSFQFKGRNEDLRQVGALLSVANILEGSVRKSGDRARITAQLIRAEDGYHLWSQTYDRTLEDIFDVQTDIAESVARALDVVLDDEQRERMQRTGIRDVDAFVDFQKGQAAFWEAHEDGIDMDILAKSAGHFTAAIAREPGFASAYYLRSDFYTHSIMTSVALTEEDRQQLYAKLQSDIALASQHARSPAQRAAIDVDATLMSTDWRLLSSRFEQALESTGCPDANWVEVAQALGNRQKAFEFYKRTISCNPLNWYSYQSAAFAALWAGRPEAALEIARTARAVLVEANLVEDANSIDLSEVLALLALGRGDEAGQIAEQSRLDMRPTILAIVAAAQGHVDDSRAFREEALDQVIEGLNAYNKVTLFAIVGDREAANAAAAILDQYPGGSALLATAVHYCQCGAPFKLDATPNFRSHLEEAGIAWPPFSPIKFPAMQTQ